MLPPLGDTPIPAPENQHIPEDVATARNSKLAVLVGAPTTGACGAVADWPMRAAGGSPSTGAGLGPIQPRPHSCSGYGVWPTPARANAGQHPPAATGRSRN